MKTLFYILTFIGGLIGGLILFDSLLADSAPQQGAGAAVAIAFVVIPYCMARVLEKTGQESLSKTLERYMEMQQKNVVQPTIITDEESVTDAIYRNPLRGR